MNLKQSLPSSTDKIEDSVRFRPRPQHFQWTLRSKPTNRRGHLGETELSDEKCQGTGQQGQNRDHKGCQYSPLNGAFLEVTDVAVDHAH